MTVKQPPSLGEAIERILASGQARVGAPVSAVLAPVAKGRKVKTPKEKPPLVAASFTPPNIWVVPVVTASESNQREWRRRSARTQAARRAVSRALAPHLRALAMFAEWFANGSALRVNLVRLGGRKLDRSNLPTALKAVEDALAFMLGADDGDPRWVVSWSQEPNAAQGVRIELA